MLNSLLPLLKALRFSAYLNRYRLYCYMFPWLLTPLRNVFVLVSTYTSGPLTTFDTCKAASGVVDHSLSPPFQALLKTSPRTSGHVHPGFVLSVISGFFSPDDP